MTEFNGELPSRGGSRLQLHVEDTCNGMWGRRAPPLGFRGKAPVSGRVRADDIFLYHFWTKLIHKFGKFSIHGERGSVFALTYYRGGPKSIAKMNGGHGLIGPSGSALAPDNFYIVCSLWKELIQTVGQRMHEGLFAHACMSERMCNVICRAIAPTFCRELLSCSTSTWRQSQMETERTRPPTGRFIGQRRRRRRVHRRKESSSAPEHNSRRRMQ